MTQGTEYSKRYILYFALFVIWLCALALALVAHIRSTRSSTDSSSTALAQPSIALRERARAPFFTTQQQVPSNLTDPDTMCPAPFNNLHRKSKLTTFLLSFFLGMFGVDRFFLEFYVFGAIKCITLGGLGIWWLIDWITVAENQLTRFMQFTHGKNERR